MQLRAQIQKILSQEDLNFLLTNRIPRVGATRLLGWFSHVENPWVVRASIALWRRLGGLDRAGPARRLDRACAQRASARCHHHRL